MRVYKSYIWMVSLFPIALLGKQIFLTPYLIVVLGLFFTYSYKTKYKIEVPIFFKIAFIFWGFLIIRSMFAEYPLKALGRIAPLILYIALSLTMYNTKESDIRKKIVWSCVIICAVLFIDGIFQYITGKDIFYGIALLEEKPVRLLGPFGSPGFAQTIAMFSLPLFSYVILLKKFYLRILLIFFLALMTFMIIFSGERSGVFLLILGIFLYFLFSDKKHIWITAGILFAILACLMLLLVPHMFERQVLTIVNASKSEYYKLWGIAIQIFKDNIFFGIGSSHFAGIICKSYRYQDMCHTHPHNLYLEILVESGIIGFLLFSIMFGSLFYYFYKFYIKLSGDMKLLFLAPIIPILARLLFFTNNIGFPRFLYAGPLWFLIGWAYSMMRSYSAKNSL